MQNICSHHPTTSTCITGDNNDSKMTAYTPGQLCQDTGRFSQSGMQQPEGQI